jgi:hypothetical protein
VYNPQIKHVELAAGTVGSLPRIVQPNSCVVAEGLAREVYNVNRTPLPDEIDWGNHIGLVFVEVEKDMFGDEIMFNVDMRILFSSRGGYN